MFGAKNDFMSTSYDGKGGSHGGATIIARGVKVEGDFQSPGDVAIEGDVEGTLGTGGLLTIGAEARVKANIKANEASVSGIIEGNIAVEKRLELKSTAKVFGDVTCETVSIEAGACMNGRMSVGTPMSASVPAAVSGKTERHRAAVSEA